MTLGKDTATATMLAVTKVVGHPELPALSAVLDIKTSDGRQIVHKQMMTEKDYCFDREAVRQMLRETIAGLPEPESARRRMDEFDSHVDEVNPRMFLRLFA